MDSASRTCFCSVECAWTLRFRQQTAAPAPAPAGDHYQYHQHHGAYGAGATTRGGGGGGHRSGDEGSTGRGHDNRGAAYADRYPQVRTEEEAEREERGAALQQTANLLRSEGVGGGVQVPTGGAVDSESDSSSPSWDGHDSRHHAMFDWQALDKDKPFGTFSDMH